MTDKELTLDLFFAGETPQELLDAACAIGTDRVSEGDSVWRNERFGSSIEALRRLANPIAAIELELARIVDFLDVAVTFSVNADGISFFVE